MMSKAKPAIENRVMIPFHLFWPIFSIIVVRVASAKILTECAPRKSIRPAMSSIINVSLIKNVELRQSLPDKSQS
jgi:hypothetical protein